MLELDGSEGEGGGQILRTALSLSMLTGLHFRIDRIRAGREKPGLRRQHLVSVQAAATVSRAVAEGAELGSQSLTFVPGEVRPGDYAFDVGSAGSTTLVLQTILPPLLVSDGPSTLRIDGGTHNPFAPPFDFLARTFVPRVNAMGPNVEVGIERAGF